MAISDPHPAITAVLKNLTPGQVHPPISVESWYLVIKSERRKPAKLNKSLRLDLQNELLNRDLQPNINELIHELTTKTCEVAK